MTKNVDEDSLYSRTLRLIKDYEQARDPDSTEIGRQFAQLQRSMIENKAEYPSMEGCKPSNRLKNRYKDVLPYDKYRVILNVENNSDYINASFVEDFHDKQRYIAAQGPIEESVEDFFRMIWELQITSIICTANDTEAGRFKFRRYWPDGENSVQFGSYRISIDETDDRAAHYEDFQIRPLIIMQGNSQRHVLLYHFIHWLDHDVPNSEAPILKLLSQLDTDRSASPDTPILVHCSAGCGRTGSMIAIDLCRLLLRDEHLLTSETYQQYPIWKIALHIRQYRIALIQTVKQYLFVHKMFAYMMKVHGIDPVLPVVHNEENFTSANSKPSLPSIASSSSRRQSGPFDLKLGNPPAGRRSNMNGTNTSHNVSPTVLPSEYFSPASNKSASSTLNEPSSPSEPPPIPPRASLLNATNRRTEGQFVGANETPVKLRRNIARSRPVKRREPVLPAAATPNSNSGNSNLTKNNRSDSADALSVHPSETYYGNRNHRAAIILDSGAISD